MGKSRKVRGRGKTADGVELKKAIEREMLRGEAEKTHQETPHGLFAVRPGVFEVSGVPVK